MERWTVVTGDRVINGRGDVLPAGVVVVEGERIKAVGSEADVEIPAGANVINMPGCTLLPGLIECHMHLAAMNVISFNNARVAVFEVSPQLQMLYALHHAQICFEMGFTTIRDMGKTHYLGENTAEMVAVREAIKNGIFEGPRILVGGRTHITSSHFDLTFPRNWPRPEGLTGDGPWELRKIARTHLRTGVDFIKTVASGGGGTDKEAPDVRNMTQEELDAIVDEAHAFGAPCACHCFTPESQKRAMRAGVDTIEHCVFTDDEAIEMLKAQDKILVPTLAHRSDRAIEARRRNGTSEFVLQKMRRIQPFTKETFQRLHKAGIRLAMGTDIQIDPEMGANALELEIYVEYGMTPMEAISTATKTAAEALQMEEQIGTLEAGKLADVIAVDGDPLQDIRLLQERNNIRLVMKEGKVCVDRRPSINRTVIRDENWMTAARI